MAESNRKDWRELCAAAAQEPDSEKLFSLVNQILQAFDERDQVGLPRRQTGIGARRDIHATSTIPRSALPRSV